MENSFKMDKPFQDLDAETIEHRFAVSGDLEAPYQFIGDVAKDLAQTIISNCPSSRERSLAITKLEEAIMWANASIARNE